MANKANPPPNIKGEKYVKKKKKSRYQELVLFRTKNRSLTPRLLKKEKWPRKEFYAFHTPRVNTSTFPGRMRVYSDSRFTSEGTIAILIPGTHVFEAFL